MEQGRAGLGLCPAEPWPWSCRAGMRSPLHMASRGWWLRLGGPRLLPPPWEGERVIIDSPAPGGPNQFPLFPGGWEEGHCHICSPCPPQARGSPAPPPLTQQAEGGGLGTPSEGLLGARLAWERKPCGAGVSAFWSRLPCWNPPLTLVRGLLPYPGPFLYLELATLVSVQGLCTCCDCCLTAPPSMGGSLVITEDVAAPSRPQRPSNPSPWRAGPCLPRAGLPAVVTDTVPLRFVSNSSPRAASWVSPSQGTPPTREEEEGARAPPCPALRDDQAQCSGEAGGRWGRGAEQGTPQLESWTWGGAGQSQALCCVCSVDVTHGDLADSSWLSSWLGLGGGRRGRFWASAAW